MLFRFLILVHVCAAFPLKCPEPAQWSTRARGFCPDPSKYFCLKNDLINGYSENCTIFDFLQPGRKHVLRGGLDADICSLERYQPWPITFYTNVSTNCIFRKSACNEQGQVIYGNGNRNTDITCRCDYTKGFDFIVKPRNRCFCVPSEEDCSCYLKMCQDSRYTLSPDYGCIHSKKNISINQCKPIFFERINRESNQSDFEDILRIQNISTAENYLTTIAILVTSISLAVLFLSYPLAKVFASCYIEHNLFSKSLSIEPTEELKEGNDVSISCEIIQKNMGGTWYKNGSPVKITDRILPHIHEKIHTLKIRNAELSDTAVYCIDFNGVKRQIQLHVEDYFSEALTINTRRPIEGNNISISCEIKQDNVLGMWFKNESFLTNTRKTKYIVNEKKHILKITEADLNDSAIYYIAFESAKRQIKLEVEAYFSANLSTNVENPTEGDDIRIECEVINYYGDQHVVQWYKDNQPVKLTDQCFTDTKERRYALVLNDCNIYDSGRYTVNVDGRKRSLSLDVKEKYKVPLEIDKMEKADKERYIKILKEGSERRYHVKLMFLGRRGVGKTSLMKRLLQETIEEVENVKPTDGIKIEKKCKVDIVSGKWIFCEGDTTEERIGRAIRKDALDSTDQSMNHDTTYVQDRQDKTQSQETIVPNIEMTGGKTKDESTEKDLKEKDNSEITHTPPIQDDEHKEDELSAAQSMEKSAHPGQKTNVNEWRKSINNDLIKTSREHQLDKMNVKEGSEECFLEINTEINSDINERNTTDHRHAVSIENVLERAFNAKVPQREYADCTMMDFAGHSEYYSTHQTFLTKNAIYLVVFSLKKDKNPFLENVDETEKLSFWIDNIHCYATQKQQNGHNATEDGLNPPIIMVCTGDDSEEEEEEEEKDEWIIQGSMMTGSLPQYNTVVTKERIDSDHRLRRKNERTSRKEECKRKFTDLLGINRRFAHIIGGINYISNKVQSEDPFNSLRTLIFDVAKTGMPEWGHHYPVRWVELEQRMEKLRNKGKNVLEFNDIIEEAKQGPLSITSEEELILFLKFQHEIGNVVFFNENILKNHIITKPTWLIDAFKCIICANEFQEFSRRTHSEALHTFEETGVISSKLCQKLFQEKSKEHAEHYEFVLSVMEKFDIFVRDKLAYSSFICPSAIRIKNTLSTYESICKENYISQDTCSFSPWLYIDFDFLPPALYNHLLVLCLHDTTFEKPKLYHEIGIFCIQKNDGSDKFVLCKLKKSIIIQSIQIQTKLEDHNTSEKKTLNTWNGQDLVNKLLRKIIEISNKYNIKLNYELCIKCGDAPFNILEDRYTDKDIKDNPSRMCHHHMVKHDFSKLIQFWFGRSWQDPPRRTQTKRGMDESRYSSTLKDGYGLGKNIKNISGSDSLGSYTETAISEGGAENCPHQSTITVDTTSKDFRKEADNRNEGKENSSTTIVYKDTGEAMMASSSQSSQPLQAMGEMGANLRQQSPKQLSVSTQPIISPNENDKKPGLAVIITGQRFAKGNGFFRNGAEKDLRNMFEIFNNLDFEVIWEPFVNRTTQDLKNELIRCTEYTTLEQRKYLVIVITSHGEVTYRPENIPHDINVYGHAIKTYNSMIPTNEILEIFDVDNCPYMEGKPKLVFIQACRSRKSTMNISTIDVHHKKETSEDLTNIIYDTVTMNDCYEDFMIAFDSTEEHTAWSEDSGGVLLTAMYNVFQKKIDNKQDIDLLQTMTEVSNKMMDYESNFTGQRYNRSKAAMCFIHMLGEEVIFKPKY